MSSALTSVKILLQDTIPTLDQNIGLLDFPGSLDTQIATRLCIDRVDYPSLCTSSVESVISSVLKLPDVPDWNNVNITVLPAQQNVVIRWLPLAYWGKTYQATENTILAFEVEIARSDNTCIAKNNRNECLDGYPVSKTLDTTNCRLSRSPKSNPLGRPSYSYEDRQTDECVAVQTDACYAHRMPTEHLPPCACSGSICSSAALSSNFALAFELMLGDFYADVSYTFRSRAVVYSSIAFERRSQLASIGPRIASAWTSWSDPVVMPSSTPPNQTPHPQVIIPRITSIEFRIYRANFNGVPITHYEFELAEDVNCDALNNLLWNSEAEAVVVPVNDTFAPFVDFRRGDPDKGGIGYALPAGVLYHYRVRAVNALDQKGPWSNHYADVPVRTGTVENPVAIYLNATSSYVNRSTCYGVDLATPRCVSIESALHAFFEVVDMRYGLTQDTYFLDKPITFGREGASVEFYSSKRTTLQNNVIVDCTGHRCFKECLKPFYSRKGGTAAKSTRCFGPSKLKGITFRNAWSIGPGSVLSRVPNIDFQQRRAVIVEDCIFTENTAFGNGGALFFRGHTERGGISIRRTSFIGNRAVAGSGGALAVDSSRITLEHIIMTNNSAILPDLCESDRYGPTCDNTCPNTSMNNLTNATCAGRGVCDDGPMGTGLCQCESGFMGLSCELQAVSPISPDLFSLSSGTNTTIGMKITNVTTNVTNTNATEINAVPASDTLGLIVAIRHGNGGAFAAMSRDTGSVVTAKAIRICNNSAFAGGGGFSLEGTTMTVVHDDSFPFLLERNTANIGGNAYVSNSILNTTRSTLRLPAASGFMAQFLIREGTAQKDGGGIACIGATLHLEAVRVSKNVAKVSGGGIFGVLCQLELVASEVQLNTAAFDGGGVYLEALSSASVLQSILFANSAGQKGGALNFKYGQSLQVGKSVVEMNEAAQGGGIYIEDAWQPPLLENTIITSNTARDGGGGGIMWERTPPRQLGHNVIARNVAQYGNNIASGIAKLITPLKGLIEATNMDPVIPELSVSIIDHYGNRVKRRNQATTVVATVFSKFCMYRTNECSENNEVEVPTCHNCISYAQSLFGRPAREIPGLIGAANFTGLGFRAWPGFHTLRLEIDRIQPIFRTIRVADCQPGHFLEVKEGVDGGTCSLCASGFHKNNSGIYPCHGCTAGFACVSGSIHPKPCTVGRFSVAESPRCNECSLGQYQPQTTQDTCIGCLAGRFANATALTHCFDCQPGLAAETDFATKCGKCARRKIFLFLLLLSVSSLDDSFAL